MIYTKIADTYRYEQFLKKHDFIYDFEILMHSINFNSNNKAKVKENLTFLSNYLFCFIFAYFYVKPFNGSEKLVFSNEELEQIIINNWIFNFTDDEDNREDDVEIKI